MSDGGTGEKTEEPTPERLRKLREDGNVSKSQDVTSAVSFLVVFCVLAGSFGFIAEEIRELIDIALIGFTSQEAPGVLANRLLMQGMITLGKCCAPVLAAAFILGISMNLAQVGFLFTLKPITPDIKKINPIQGFKNLVNMKKLVELLKTIIKFTAISIISYFALNDAMRDVILTIRSDLTIGMLVTGEIIWDFCIRIGAVFVVIALADALYQKKRYIKDNRMSKYDIKQEYKQSEGDPQLKAERKQLHREMANGSGQKGAVKKADVVVRNPDHIAVAIKYNKETDDAAPTVVAKGERIWAEKILEEARHYGVPIVRNVPLAQALNKVDVGNEIPEELYDAVAEVLNFVYTLAEEQQNKGKKKLPRGKRNGQ
ncbi:MAG: EscU/YscU/HrcU family type III secretion system export apparatus switch protein [Myxococcota bacterium]|nr:EscU/YscU/HrcU family type III secretion system export apparatus switch protein [Myxococcota bacterium]